jgi:hypothetical protein
MNIVMDDRQAIFPLTVDPIIQQAFIKACNTDEGDYSGLLGRHIWGHTGGGCRF